MRLYETVRTAHLERAHQLAPATIIFRVQRADFDHALAEGLDVRQLGTLRMVRTLARRPPDVLEVNEPLMIRAIPRALLAIMAVRIGGQFARTRTRVVSYAIENRDPLKPGTTRRSGAKARVKRRLAMMLMRRLDRIVYGTSAAGSLYRELLGPMGSGTAEDTVPALPAPCACADEPKDPGLVLFVGAFEERKGLGRLLTAWPRVAETLPDTRLVLVGTGVESYPMLHDRGRLDSIKVIADPPRAEIHRWQRRAAVCVLLSQPTAGWREQVGLPIVEGLAHGCRVLASDQSGLADWLLDHGHLVVRHDVATDGLAHAIISALTSAASPDAIVKDLPLRDGRLAADDLMIAD